MHYYSTGGTGRTLVGPKIHLTHFMTTVDFHYHQHPLADMYPQQCQEYMKCFHSPYSVAVSTSEISLHFLSQFITLCGSPVLHMYANS